MCVLLIGALVTSLRGEYMNRKEYVTSILDQHRRGEVDDKGVFDSLHTRLMFESNGKLYRYRSFESQYSLSEVEGEYIFCSKPSMFNDPFDCKMGFDIQAVIDEGVLHMLSCGDAGFVKGENEVLQAFLEQIDIGALKKEFEETDGSTEAYMKMMKGHKDEISDWLISLNPGFSYLERIRIIKGVDTLFETLNPQKVLITLEGELLLTESLEASLNLNLDADQIGKMRTFSKYMDPELKKDADPFEVFLIVFLQNMRRKLTTLLRCRA